MEKQILRYSLGSLLFMMAACNTPNTVEKPQPEPEIAVVEEPTWQAPYSEEQEVQHNELPVVAIKPEPIVEIDLWQRIRQGYALPQTTLHANTEKQLAWFIRHPDYIDRFTERARPYLFYIVEQIEQRNMPMEIALLPVVESAFQPFAYSPGRAAGLWQFIPDTGKHYGMEQDWWYDGRRDVIESTRGALDYLQKLHNDFGDWHLALAAYNSGEGTVAKAIKRNLKAGKDTGFWSLKLPKETSAYVPKLMAIAHLIDQPQRYQITLKTIENKAYFAVVDIEGQIDLALAAKLAGLKIEEIYRLNPGFNQWATAPDGPHRLLFPVEKEAVFQQALAKLPADERVQWARYEIKEGDYLGKIAQQYKTAIAVIKKTNDIKGSNIRAGKHLLIPVASGQPADYSLSASQRLTSHQNKPQKGRKNTYVVKNGDTWWDIAQLYKVSVKKLTAWNNKSPRDYLQPNQKLVVWAQSASAQSKTGDTMRSVSYTIRHGDSLWVISQKFKVSITQVCQWNGLNKKALLQPGQNLKLYVDVTEQHGNI